MSIRGMMNMGASNTLSFEDLEVGQTFVGRGRTLTEADLSLFTMMTGDWHPIHVDEEFARTTKIGHRMFQGTFGVALAVAMAADAVHFSNPVIAALGIRDWSFKQPLLIADTVHVEVEIVDKRITSDGRRAIVGRKVRLVKSDGTVLQEGATDLMVAMSPSGDERQGDAR
jgi:acyl dehydratase